jgi:hypothetical protein
VVSLAQDVPSVGASAVESPTAPEETFFSQSFVSNGDASSSKSQPQAAGGQAGAEGRFDFSKTPPSRRALPRLGMFPLAPSGPGYYSGWDALLHEEHQKPPQYPFPFFALSPLSFYDADWRFVDDPNYRPDALERLKRIHLDDNWLVSTGGQAWWRYQNEYNSRLTESNNTYSLVRARPYVDVWYQDRFRFFLEGIFADSLWQDIPPSPTDIDRGDFQNLFVEARVAELADKPVFARVGRQEVSLGSMRLVGTPDWGNTRRTWDGARVFRNGEKWDFDLFWLQPILPNPSQLNIGDHDQNFAGSWLTYRPKKGTFIDGYYLMLDNAHVIQQQGIDRAPFTIHTFGGRYASDYQDRFLWDTEVAVQLGNRGSTPIFAGMFTGGAGYHCAELPWNPTLWAVYNYTSGDDDPNSGAAHTFNQLFPFIHYYMGWVDAVGRQNNHDLNLRLYLYPQDWITVWLQYHHFWLDSPTDALYNISGNAYRRDPTGLSGTDVGQKAEALVNFHLTKRSDLYCVYSYLWGGEFLRNTAGPNAAVNSSGCYVGYSLRW